MTCEGQDWTVCDVPGAEGEHLVRDPKTLWLREVGCLCLCRKLCGQWQPDLEC